MIVEAMYRASYNDYNGIDEVPCEVDLDARRVTEFFPALSCRWNGLNETTFVMEETIVVGDDVYEAIEQRECDRLMDAYGYSEDEILYSGDGGYYGAVIYDYDQLAEACYGA